MAKTYMCFDAGAAAETRTICTTRRTIVALTCTYRVFEIKFICYFEIITQLYSK